MRLLTRSTLLAAVNTNRAQWIVPPRLALGMLLVFPIDGNIEQLFAFHHADPSTWSFVAVAGVISRTIEVFAGMSFIGGCGIRLAVYPIIVLFALRAIANFANSSTGLRGVASVVVVPHGDWRYGAMYLAVALLLGDLLDTGSGDWSVDYWLAGKLQKVTPRSAR
jgi:putative oxidoreductase